MLANSSNSITILKAHNRSEVGFVQCFINLMRNLVMSRELIAVLFKRDFFAVYKKSYLGIGWLFITPLVSALSWIFMQATGILNPGEVGIPYPAYVLLSTTVWTFFVGFYLASADTLNAGAGFIMQVKYPHEALLVKQIAQHLAGSIINFVMMFSILLAFGVIPSWKTIFIIPMAVPLVLLAAGIGLIVSVLSVVIPEVRKFTDIIMNLLVFITPVIYSARFDSPLLQKVMTWNPLTYLVGGFRDMILGEVVMSWQAYAASAFLGLAVFMIAWRLFYLSEEHVIEKMI